MIEEGAAIIDVGGESTRPGAVPVAPAEEQRRILPVIEAWRRGRVLISVDTYREETARLAVEAGAHIVNDVHGLQREPGIARVAAASGAGLVIMHTGRDREKLPDVVGRPVRVPGTFAGDRPRRGVRRRPDRARSGVRLRQGIEENVDLMARFGELWRLGIPGWSALPANGCSGTSPAATRRIGMRERR